MDDNRPAPGKNLIKFARNRDRARNEFLDLHPASYAQIWKAGIYPTIEKTRERVSRGVQRGEVTFVGLVVDEDGYDVKMFARFPVNQPQHEYEVTALVLVSGADATRRGQFVDKYLSDAELIFRGVLRRLERDRGTEGIPKLIERMKCYEGCPDDVLWVMDSKTRINNVLNKCKPSKNHWFTTYAEAIENFQSPAIWINGAGVNPAAQGK